MVFPSIPIYLDPSNWNQQQSQPQLGTNTVTATASENHAVQLPPVNLMPNITNPSSLNRVPNPEPGLKCPRCNSTNTKFCYFNNYSLSQPRHFCRTCRRYWTRGGTLRNVPVGGGSRRNSKRSKTSSTNATSAQNSSNLVSSTMHQIGISSLGTNLDAQNVGMGFPGMQMQMPMQFPFIGQLGQNTVPMQMGSISSHFNLNSRNDIGGTSNSTGGTVGASGKESNTSAWHIGLSGINPSSSGNIFQ